MGPGVCLHGRSGLAREAAAPLRSVPFLENTIAPLVGEQSHDVAQLLIGAFGSIGRVLTVSEERLQTVLSDYPDAGVAICAARRLVSTGRADIFEGTPLDVHDGKLISFIAEQICNPDEERLFAVFIDIDGCYLIGELLARGSRTGVAMQSRTVIQRALDLGAANILLAHNHVSGRSAPSAADRHATARLQAIAEAMEIGLADHLIFGTKEVFSMREGKRL